MRSIAEQKIGVSWLEVGQSLMIFRVPRPTCPNCGGRRLEAGPAIRGLFRHHILNLCLSQLEVITTLHFALSIKHSRKECSINCSSMIGRHRASHCPSG